MEEEDEEEDASLSLAAAFAPVFAAFALLRLRVTVFFEDSTFA